MNILFCSILKLDSMIKGSRKLKKKNYSEKKKQHQQHKKWIDATE